MPNNDFPPPKRKNIYLVLSEDFDEAAAEIRRLSEDIRRARRIYDLDGTLRDIGPDEPEYFVYLSPGIDRAGAPAYPCFDFVPLIRVKTSENEWTNVYPVTEEGDLAVAFRIRIPAGTTKQDVGDLFRRYARVWHDCGWEVLTGFSCHPAFAVEPETETETKARSESAPKGEPNE